MSNYFNTTPIKDISLNKFDEIYKREHGSSSKSAAHEAFSEYLKTLSSRNNLNEEEKQVVGALQRQLKVRLLFSISL